MADNINNVNVINNMFEGNSGLGIVVNSGVNVLIQGNVFESLGAPSVFARAVGALKVTANYFEANNIGPHPIVHFVNETTGQPVELCAEIVLDGAAQQGDLPYKYDFDAKNISLGDSAVLCESAVLTANFHNAAQSYGPGCAQLYVGLASFGSANGIIESNQQLGCSKYHPGQACVMGSGVNVSDSTNYRVGFNSGWHLN
jgi:hypothetical protein